MVSSLANTYNNESMTYQHLQGCILLNLNKLAPKLKLSHSEYRLMATIVGLYNKKLAMAFPSIDYLASCCCMSKSTILKCLSNLVNKGLLLINKTKSRRNSYYISNLLLTGEEKTPGVLFGGTSCDTAYISTNRTKTNINITSSHDKQELNNLKQRNNNDDAFKSTEYKIIVNQLEQWCFTGAKFAIKRYGLERIKHCIELTKQKNPDNSGGYLRSLLTVSDCSLNELKQDNLKDTNISDDKNKPLLDPLNVNGLDHCKKIQKINEIRLSKTEILQKLLNENKTEEVEVLKKLWKL